MLTDDMLVKASTRSDLSGGEARYYRLPNGYGLSVQSDKMLHAYPFAWEIAVCKGLGEDGLFEDLTYDTPLTDDVEVFYTDAEANAFISRAKAWARQGV